MTKGLGLLFLGIALGSLNPERGLLGWIVPMIVATMFIGIDLLIELKNNGEKK